MMFKKWLCRILVAIVIIILLAVSVYTSEQNFCDCDCCEHCTSQGEADIYDEYEGFRD